MTPAEGGKLSKEEVDALLEATQEEEESTQAEPEPTRRVHRYDFQQPSRFNKAALESLREINSSLAQTTTKLASRLLRTGVKTQLVSMEQMKWENMVEEAGETVAGYLFSMAPLGFKGLVTVPREFAASCLDRMTGGSGEVPEGGGEFSDLEVRALARFVTGFLEPLPALWSNIGEFQVELGSFVDDVPGLDLFTPDEDLFQLCFLLQGSAGSGQIALSVPFQAVKSLPPQEGEAGPSVAAGEKDAEAGLRESLKRSQVELAVVLGAANVKVARLLRIEPGDVIVLDKRLGEPLDVKVNDKVKLKAFPGVAAGKHAAKVILEE